MSRRVAPLALLALTIVLVDNTGGGIFSMLPQLKEIEESVFEKVVATPQAVDIARVIEGFGIQIHPATTASQLHDLIVDEPLGIKVVHVKTDRAANVQHHADLHAAVSAAFTRQ